MRVRLCQDVTVAISVEGMLLRIAVGGQSGRRELPLGFLSPQPNVFQLPFRSPSPAGILVVRHYREIWKFLTNYGNPSRIYRVLRARRSVEMLYISQMTFSVMRGLIRTFPWTAFCQPAFDGPCPCWGFCAGGWWEPAYPGPGPWASPPRPWDKKRCYSFVVNDR